MRSRFVGRAVGRAAAVLVGLIVGAPAAANNYNLDRLNAVLHGKVHDFTNNHGQDRRLYSACLQKWRDAYVYVPPNYCAETPCNLVVWIHGAFGDEQIAFFLARIEVLDALIACGACGPTIAVFPDATLSGLSNPLAQHSFFVNGRAGPFEDHLLQEILGWVQAKWCIRPERDAHAIAGPSAGGFAALSIGIRRRDWFGHIAAVAPPANLRYDNCNRRYFADFNPAEYRWREEYRPREVVGTFLAGMVRLREGPFIEPIFGPKQCLLENVKKHNPADLLITENIQPGELDVYIRYPKRDNFNFDAQVESFDWIAKSRGVQVTLQCDPDGTHTVPYFQDSMPTLWEWLAKRLPNDRWATADRRGPRFRVTPSVKAVGAIVP